MEKNIDRNIYKRIIKGLRADYMAQVKELQAAKKNGLISLSTFAIAFNRAGARLAEKINNI